MALKRISAKNDYEETFKLIQDKLNDIADESLKQSLVDLQKNSASL